jgi:uncharacterized membrane protein YjjP (DUF1212 family)
MVTLGWGLMGTGIALTLGGNAVVCVLAFLAACAIYRTQQLMSQHRIPSFYQQVAGGFVATLIAVTAAVTPLEVNPSRVVTGSSPSDAREPRVLNHAFRVMRDPSR